MIGLYNEQTLLIQIILLILLIMAIFSSYSGKIRWIAKFALGIANLYIGIVFFGIYGTEPIQYYFAFPLYVLCGLFFIYESIKNKEDILEKPNWWQMILLFMYLIYPILSIILGNTFPKMVTHIMPCPIISLSIAVYSSYKEKNKLLLTLMMIWGLTGVKSFFFNAYEDIILLICGIYGALVLFNEIKIKHK